MIKRTVASPVAVHMQTDANGQTDDAELTDKRSGRTDFPAARRPCSLYTGNIFNNNNNICIHERQGAGVGEREVRPFDPLVRKHLRLITADDHPHPEDTPPEEPTDEELWLEEVARQVEADARPLFAVAWLELLRRALQRDEDDQAEEPA